MLINSFLQQGFTGISVISLGLSLILIILACRTHWKRSQPRDREGSKIHLSRPPVSVIVPVHNEEVVVSETIKALRQSAYPCFEVIIVNDGSTDASLEILHDVLRLSKVSCHASKNLTYQTIQQVFQSRIDHRIRVIDKANGGKYDALNAGIALSSYPWFCCVDADTVLLPDALDKMMRKVEEDPTIVGLAGQVRVGNDLRISCFWVSAQIVEYIRSFVMERIGWSVLQGLIIVPGAFSLFNKKAVCEVGGYSAGMPTEDVELVLKLHRHWLGQNRAYRIEYVHEAMAFTEVPTNLYSLAKQRERWYRGLWMAIYHHRDMLWRRHYKIVGLFVLPYLLLLELLWPMLSITVLLILSTTSLMYDATLSVLSAFTVVFAGRYLLTIAVLLFDRHLHHHCSRGQFRSIFWSSFLELSAFSILLCIFKIQAFAAFFVSSSVEDGKWSTSRQRNGRNIEQKADPSRGSTSLAAQKR